MEALRKAFEELGLSNVETFIASGNVIFESRSSAGTLEQKIAKHLHKTLGYEVTTFVRSNVELAAVANHRAFPAAKLNAPDATLFIGFLHTEPSTESPGRVLGYPGGTDEFHFHQRELYWLCRTRLSDSAFSGARLEKLLGLRVTLRNANTINRLIAKYPPAPVR